MFDLDDWVGVAVLAVSLAILGTPIVYLRGRMHPSAVFEALARVAFLPARRRRFLRFLGLEACFFLAAGILLGMESLGVNLPVDWDLAVSVPYLAGVVAMGWLLWTSLGSQPLSPQERIDLQRDAPSMMESLWLIPYHEPKDPSREHRRKP